MKKIIVTVVFIASLLLSVACAGAGAKHTAPNVGSITYYTDIPDITDSEKAAIEALKSSYGSFSYGVLIGTEMFVLPDGTYEGFSFRLCELLSTLFGVEFKAELYDEWEVLNRKYADTEIDFIGELCATPERMELYKMSNPIAEHALRIFTKTYSEEIKKESDLNGLNVGFLRDTITASYVQKAYPFLEMNIVDTDSYKMAVDMLMSGEIDAFVEDADSDMFFLDYEEIQSKKFFPMVYSPISMSTANHELGVFISVLDKYLAAGGTDKLLELYDDGEHDYASYKLERMLTDEEKSYLATASQNPIKLASRTDLYPINFYNKSEKEYQGIAQDILAEISHISGIRFETVTDRNMSFDEMLTMLEDGDAAMITNLLHLSGREDAFLWSETPYSSAYYAFLSKLEYPDLSIHQILRRNVGIIDNPAHESVFFEWFPEHEKFKWYASEQEGIEALGREEIELLMGTEYMMLNQSNYNENTGLKMNIILSTPVDVYFGFNKDEGILRSIVDKAQAYINIETIERKWLNRTFDFQNKAATERMYYFMSFSAVLFLVLVLVMLLLRRNKKLNTSLGEIVAERTSELDRQTGTLSTIYKSIPDIVFSKDLNLRYTTCNDKFAEYLRLPGEQIIGKKTEDLFADKEFNDSITKMDLEVLNTKQMLTGEETLVSYDGRRQTFEATRLPLFQNGELIGLMGIARNITERKTADERIKVMLEAIPLCCTLIDRNANIIDCNNEVVTLFDLKDKSEYMKKFGALSPEFQPDGQLSSEKSISLIRRTLEYGKTVTEWIHQKKDGTLIPCEVTLVRVAYGNEYVAAGYARDLRQSKKMLEELEHKDNLLQTVNNVASILLKSGLDEFERNLTKCMGMLGVAVDADRVYIWKNHTREGNLYATQIYEWTANVKSQQGKSNTIDVSYSEVAPGWEKILSSGHCINDMVCNLSIKEQLVFIPRNVMSILVVPVFLRNEFWGFVGFDDYHRMREFSKEEEVVLRSGALLIAYALLRNEMTLDISSAVEKAQAASRAKSNFLSNMSHEIRTPLNAIIGMTLIGKSTRDSDKKDYALGKIVDASNHLLGVINDILDMSKIEADKLEISNEEFVFEDMLQKVVSVINFRIHEKHQHFAVFVDSGIPRTLIGDSQRIAQVITNLLSNAVKFTPEDGAIRLDARSLCEVDGIFTLQIEVTDTGIGIAPEKHSQLFKAFVQAENDTSRKFGGTGLGLSISKHIVELMDGSIWVESEIGKGAKFAFTLKVGRGTDKDVPSQLKLSGKNIRILTVDDDPETREYFVSIAEQLGIPCDTASSGTEALKLIDDGVDYNIFFVDMRMPEMDGIELSREIKARGLENCVIIMISAFDWSDVEKDAKEAGVDKFLPKPLFYSTVAELINECLGVGDAMESSEKQDSTPSFKGFKMLLTEDVEINRDIVTALLEPTEIEIECAGNGIECLEKFEKAPDSYDLIFMDIQMPGMDGLEATRRLRALDAPKARKIPIIAMTANVFKEDIDKCDEAGMNDHLGKPIDYDEMIAKMKKYLTASEKASPTAALKS